MRDKMQKTSIKNVQGMATALPYTIDSKKKKINYNVVDPFQSQFVKKITILGFTKLPSGFKKNGKGIPSRGYLLLKKLSEKFKKFDLIVSAKHKSSLKIKGVRNVITINHADLQLLLREFRTFTKKAWEQQNESLTLSLARAIPSKFKPPKDRKLNYQKNDLANLLHQPEILDNLSSEDIQKLNDFYPKFFDHYSDKLTDSKRLAIVSKNRKATEIRYLESIIKEYERKLKSPSQNEHKWQEFLRDYILLCNSNYTGILEKKNIALEGKYPDFLMINVYNYLDIYEIKKPNTSLLKYDKSRGNYYWDTEIGKAISQVENYIHYINRNGPSLRDEIKRIKNIDIRVVKPRGFIIAGQRKQLTGEVMEDNFRLLNSSLKNVEIVLYDELLDNLKNFLKRLKKT
jgi:hypothetical protein